MKQEHLLCKVQLDHSPICSLPDSELCCQSGNEEGVSPSSPSYGTLLFGSRSPQESSTHVSTPKRWMPNPNQEKKPVGKQLSTFESASTRLASWVEFVSFAVVLILQ